MATVGVVALLVGAISARQARGRACLSFCLDNEDSNIAVDHTIEPTSTSHYATFWIGYLEKFDI